MKRWPVLIVFLAGCLHQRGSISSLGTTVTGVPDAGKPATLAQSDKGESLPIPAGSKVTVTKSEALAAVPATKDIPAQKAEPAKEVTEVVLAKDTVWKKEETNVKADTGTVDTSVRQHEIDVSSAQPLLYASILSGLGAILCLYLKYPTPAAMCGGAAVVFLVAWKVSNAPSWLWGLGAIGLAAAAALYFGHEKGLSTPKPQ